MGRLQFCLKLLAYWIFDTFFSTICRREYREEARCKKTTQTGRQAGRQCSQALSIFLVHTPKCFWLYDFKLKYEFAYSSCSSNSSILYTTYSSCSIEDKPSIQADPLPDRRYPIKTLHSASTDSIWQAKERSYPWTRLPVIYKFTTCTQVLPLKPLD